MGDITLTTTTQTNNRYAIARDGGGGDRGTAAAAVNDHGYYKYNVRRSTLWGIGFSLLKLLRGISVAVCWSGV